MKNKFFAPVFWALLITSFLFIIGIAVFVAFIFSKNFVLLLYSIILFSFGIALVYFLIQRIKEIKQENKRPKEYDKY